MGARSLSGLVLLSAALGACSGSEGEVAAPYVERFEASVSLAEPGQRFELEWSVTGADTITLATGDGVVVIGESDRTQGRTMVGPLTAPTVFVLRAEGPGGRVGASVLVRVNYPAPEITSFVAQPDVILPSDPSFLFWQTTNATAIVLRDGAGAALFEGTAQTSSITVRPEATTIYRLDATGPGGTDTATATVVVRGTAPVVVSFTAEPEEIYEGDTAQLRWQTAGAQQVVIVDGSGAEITRSAAASGFVDVRPTETTDFGLTATNPDGSAQATTKVVVNVLEAPKLELLAADPSVVGVGGHTRVTWVMGGAETYRLLANGQELFTRTATADEGRVAVAVTSTRTVLRLEIDNRIGTDAAEVEVLGHRAPIIDEFTVTPTLLGSSGSVDVRWQVRNVAGLTLLRDGAPLPGFPPVAETGPTIDAQGMLTVPVVDVARFELNAASAGGALRASALVVVGIAEQEPNETPALATSVTSTSGRLRGALSSSSDVDVYRIDVPDDGRVRAETFTGANQCDLDTRLTLTATDGATVLVVDDDDGIGACSQIEPTRDAAASGLRAGFYFLTVEAGGAAAGEDYVLVFEARKPTCGDGVVEGTEQCDDGNPVDGDGCNGSCFVEIATVIGPPSGSHSQPHPGGIGYFTVAVDLTVPGQSIQARASDPAGGGCNTVDTRLVLTDATGAPLGERSDGGPSGAAGDCAALSAPADAFATNLAAGRYHLQVFSENGASGPVELLVTIIEPACPNGIIETRAGEQCDDGNAVSGDGCSASCRVEASTVNEVEPNDSQADAFATGLTNVGVITIVGANTPAGDDDVFSFVVPAGQTLRMNARTFSVQGQPTSCNSQTTDTRMFLERAGTEVTDPSIPGAIAYNDDIDNPNNIWCSALTGIPLLGGVSGATYYVRVQGWRDTATTQYRLRVELTP